MMMQCWLAPLMPVSIFLFQPTHLQEWGVSNAPFRQRFQSPLAEDVVDVSVSIDFDLLNPVGQRTTYALIVSNAGPSIATEILLTNEIPDSLSSPMVIAAEGAYSISESVLKWSLPSLAPGQHSAIVVEVTPNRPGEAVITASARPSQNDPNFFLNNICSARMTLGVADLSVSVIAPSTVQAAVPFDVSVVVTNAGPDAAPATLFTTGFSDFETQSYTTQGEVVEVREMGLPWQIEFESIPPSTAVTLFLQMTPLRTGTLNILASTSSPVMESDVENNIAISELISAPGPGFLSLVGAQITVMESEGVAVVHITRTEGDVGVVQVDYITRDASAINGRDYLTAQGTIAFQPGETNKTITVPIVDNGRSDCNREFTIAIGPASGSAKLTQSTNVSIQIFDDEIQSSGSLEAVSLSTNKVETGNGETAFSALSSDGRIVTFTTLASDLMTGDTNGGADVYWKNLETGVVRLVSENRSGTGPGNSDSAAPVMTPDGRFVAFMSYATDLVTNDCPANIAQIYLRDMWDGTTRLVSVLPNGQGANARQQFITQERIIFGLSDDANVIAFWNDGTNLSNGSQQLFVRDMLNESTELITVTASGAFAANVIGLQATLSRNGRFIAFVSGEENILPNFRNIRRNAQIYVRDLVENKTVPVSVDWATGGPASEDGFNSGNFNPHFASDNALLIFQSNVNRLVADDSNPHSDIFMRNLTTGNTTRLSVGIDGPCEQVSVSDDGRFVAFRGGFRPGEPGPVPSSNSSQIYVRDLWNNVTILASVACGSAMRANGHSFNPTISRDGRMVYFQSFASDLAPGYFQTGDSHLFRRDTQLGTTVLVAQDQSIKGAGKGLSSLAGFDLESNVSWDGNTAVASSTAPNLVFEDSNAYADLFLWRAGIPRLGTPSIAIMKSATGVTVRWPLKTKEWRLQSKSDWAEAQWTDVETAGAIFQTGERSEEYFRLRSPGN